MMTIDEAIYCMQSYLPEDGYYGCKYCPYYGAKKLPREGGGVVRVCRSNEAHKMAIEALKAVKIIRELGVDDVS